MEEKKVIKTKQKWWVIVGAILLIAFYLFCICQVSLQNDTLFDIKMGEKYVTEGIQTQDTFSIHENLNYVSHHFLVNIITYFVYHIFGFQGLYVLELLLASVLTLLLYLLNRNFIKSKKISYLLLFLELFMLAPFISVRAQMYSYLLFALEILCIEKFLRGKKFGYLAVLSLIPLLLINLHAGTIFFYFIILFVYLLNYISVKFRKVESDTSLLPNLKYLVIPIIAGAVLMFCNPFGLDGVTYSLKTLGNTFINSSIAEFQPPTINGAVYVYLYLFFFINVYLFCKNKIKLHHLLFCYGTMLMTLMSYRHFSLFVIVSITSLGYVADMIKEIVSKFCHGVLEEKKATMRGIMIGFYILCVIGVGSQGLKAKETEYLPKDTYPHEAVAYLKEHSTPEQKIFNEYIWGSLLMMNDMKVFIDSRCDLYTPEYNPGVNIANDYLATISCSENYKELLKKYDIDWILVGKDSAISKNMTTENEYQKEYEDDTAVIYRVIKE